MPVEAEPDMLRAVDKDVYADEGKIAEGHILNIKARTWLVAGALSLVLVVSSCASGPAQTQAEGMQAVSVLAYGGEMLDPDETREFLENSTPIDPDETEFAANEDLNEAEVLERADELAEVYAVGEPLGEVDLEFVRAYLIPVDQDTAVTVDPPTVVTAGYSQSASQIELAANASQSWTFAQTRRTAAGVRAATQGSSSITWFQNGGVLTTWSAGWTAKRESGASLRKMVSTLSVQLYGAVAAPPYVGMITNWSRSETKSNVQSTYFSRNGSAVGAVLYYNMSGNTVFTTSSGSFQIGN